MTRTWIALLSRFTLLALGALPAAHADDGDALSLQVEPAPASTADAPWRASIEMGVGRIDDRSRSAWRGGRRTSLDLRYNNRLADSWSLSLSDRLDDTHPAPDGTPTTTNSLREAYLSWQDSASARSFELGRINLRQGPAYGYNPTDYFRAGALRSITTADPVTLRQTRMGTVMLLAGQLGADGGGLALAFAPKLTNPVASPDQRPSSLDLSATNASTRTLVTINARASERISGQGSVLLTSGRPARVGLNATALASDSLVAHGEWSLGKSPSLLDQLEGNAGDGIWAQQAAAGLTYTFAGALSMAAEAEYNGAGLTHDGWSAVTAQGPAGYLRYVALTQPSQELGSRRAWLFYLSQKGLGAKQLDLTALVHVNGEDHSRLAWAELRYHWPRFDAAVQWQLSFGSRDSEYGLMPYRQVWQVVGVFFL